MTESSALLTGVSRYEAGQERSQLFRGNEQVATEQAQSEFAAGAANEESQRLKSAALAGQQRAQFGGANLQQGGTPTQVVASTAEIGEMDALRIRNNAARRAWGFEVQGASDELQSDFAHKAGIASGVESILGGTGTAYKQYSATGSYF